MYAGGNKGRLKGYILHPPTVKIDGNHTGAVYHEIANA